MDRPLDEGFRRTRRLKRLAAIGGAVALALAAFVWGPGWITPSVSKARIRTARVEAGPIEAVIEASGTVVPEIEEVVSSPVDARVVRIIQRAGAELLPGQPLVELDASESALAVDRLSQNLALKLNQQDKTRLELERSLNELDSQARIKDLQLQAHRAQLARNRALATEGLISEEILRQTELAEAQAVVELKKIQAERDNAQRLTRATLDGLALEMGTLRKELDEARRQLTLAAPRATRHGVLTWSLSEEGSSIRKGEVIARIADLSSFRVDATLSDVHAKRVSIGLPATVRVGDESLEGVVSNILPTIRNGVMTLQVLLKDKSNGLLRSNLRVDVFIVTGRRAKALRVHRGPFADGEGPADVFVVHGGRGVKTRVDLGIAGFEDYEVVRGLAEGDEVIVSDMKDYMHLDEIRIRN
ncbi:MAG TPA: HlyD family efflux transporter periplasmic adaptor subunit [Vicinamibacterales bacterium]|nr:HlyD family efflux transporter periplasmic adaptor subunit [Vicinamibacterales bacterium]